MLTHVIKNPRKVICNSEIISVMTGSNHSSNMETGTTSRVQGIIGIIRGIKVSVITVPRIKSKTKIVVKKLVQEILVTEGITQTFLTSRPKAMMLLSLIPSKERVDAEAAKTEPYFRRKLLRPLPMQSSNASSTTFLFKDRN